jgi:hypothetical protein
MLSSERRDNELSAEGIYEEKHPEGKFVQSSERVGLPFKQKVNVVTTECGNCFMM